MTVALAIEVEELSKVYGKTTALDRVSFAIPSGQIVGLLGHNGAGKSTLMHCLLGLLTPTAGGLRLLGMAFERNRGEIYGHINFASADADLPFNLTVKETLQIYSRWYGVEHAASVIDDILESTGLTALADRVIGVLSSGESMRVKLAKALLNRPQVLLLDEPTVNLDPFTANKMRDLIREMHGKRPFTILLTSHNMIEVEQFCERILFLHHGRLIADGSPAEVLRRFGDDNLESLFLKIAQSGDLIDVGEIA
jgi:ABC-2 type transport system ATP-binding protein